MMKKRFFILILMTITCFSISAQGDDTNTLPNLTLVNVQSVGEIITNTLPHTATLSPDGNLIAYEGGSGPGICIYNFTNENTTCTPYPQEDENGERVRLRQPPEVRWSPDSRVIAITENSLIRIEDGDIWLFDVEAQTFTDRTQDGYSGRVLMGADSYGVPIDVLPTWSPDGSLYFFRYIRDEDSTTTQLFKIPYNTGSFAGVIGSGERGLSDGDPILIADLTDATDTPFAFYNGSGGFSLSGTTEISPDGTKMAIISRPQSPTSHEIWVFDLTDGTITRRIPTSQISGVGLPDWVENQGFIAEGITWVNDHELAINFINPQAAANLAWTAYSIDLETDAVTPIFDFASVPSMAEYITGTRTDSGLVTYPIPRYAVITPDKNYFMYVTAPLSINGAALEALPIHGGERLILHEIGEDFRPLPTVFTSIGTGGNIVRALISGYIFTFEITG